MFVAAHRDEVDRTVQSYAAISHLAGACDRERAEASVSALYAYFNLPAPKFIWFDSPIKACRLITLWDLMEAMLSLGPGNGENWLMLSASAVRKPKQEKLPSLRQQFLMEASPREKMSQWDADTQWQLISMSRDSAHYASYDVAVRGQVSQQLFKDMAQPENWREDWNTIQQSAEAISEHCGENWRQFADIFWTLPDIDQHSLLNSAIREEFESPTRDNQHSPLNFFRNEFGLLRNTADARLLSYMQVANLYAEISAPVMSLLTDCLRHCGWWRPERLVCFMVERPETVELDQTNRLHRRVVYPDGETFYGIHGVAVAKEIATGEFNAHDIDAMENVEVRRVMIEDYGLGKYLKETNAQEIQRDEFGVLYRKEFRWEEPIMIVQVRNSTPEPDGTFKDYYLRVPPSTVTAREAVAWSFGMNAEEYKPAKET